MSQNIQITQIFVILRIKLIRYSSCDVGRSVTVSGYTPSQHPMSFPHCFELHNQQNIPSAVMPRGYTIPYQS